MPKLVGETTEPRTAGVTGTSSTGAVVVGMSNSGIGVHAISEQNEGVHGETKSTKTAAIAAFHNNPNSKTAALYAKHAGNRTAAVFEGNVIVTGDIKLPNAGYTENFDIDDVSVDSGTVMIFGEDGSLQQSQYAYDKRVVDVVSGAGNYKPGIILDKQQEQMNRKRVALMGKVYCKVDADYAPIEIGDLLTTSTTLGHAMKAIDPFKAFETVNGKAMHPLKEGKELIPILVALQ